MKSSWYERFFICVQIMPFSWMRPRIEYNPQCYFEAGIGPIFLRVVW